MNTHKGTLSATRRREFAKLIAHLKKTRAGRKEIDHLNTTYKSIKKLDSVLADIKICNMSEVKIVSLTYTVCENTLETAHLHHYCKFSVLND